MRSADTGRDIDYRSRIFRRYLWISLLPASFFVLLGAAAILLSQGFVMNELRDLERKTLSQVSAGIELIFGEADSLALSISTDAELISSLEHGLSVGIPTLADLRKTRSVQSVLASAVNSRRYLNSIYASTIVNGSEGSLMTSSDGILPMSGFPDAAWVDGAEDHADLLQFWMRRRDLRLLPAIDYSIPVVTLYRNLIAPGDLSRRGTLAVNVDLRYIEQMIEDGFSASAATGDGGGFVLMDRATGLPLAGRPLSAEDAARILPLLGDTASRHKKPVALGSSRYFVSSTVSPRFPFAYVLLTPESAFYRIPVRIAATALAFAVLSLALGGALILASTRRNFALLDGIIAIVDAAGKGRELPAFHESKNKDLDFVSLSILRTFVEHDYYKVRLSEQELRRRTLELLALQAQMSPHFLFNTLTSISFKAMALTGKPNDLTKMVEHLSGILGYALKDPRKTVSLGEEAEYAADYLEIQHLRFGDRIRCEWKIADDTLDAACPRLLLQPLVENATEHGRKPSGEVMHITISSSLEAGRVRFSVADDGTGIEPGRLEEILREAEAEEFSVAHIGLINTLKRLRLSFGEDCDYHILSEGGCGTVVELGFPYRRSEESAVEGEARSAEGAAETEPGPPASAPPRRYSRGVTR